jgi:hypothetical protein
MGVRVGAYLIDALLLTLIDSVVLFPSIALTGDSRLELLLGVPLKVVTLIIYFTLLEGIWGASLGKRALGLRVSTAIGNAVPGVPRALLRTGFFYLVVNLGSLVALVLLILYVPSWQLDWHEPQNQHLGLPVLLAILPTGGYLVGLVCILAPMRARNGYRGLHEFISGTRVLAVPWSRKRRLFKARGVEHLASQPDALPERVGPYVVQAALRWTAADQLLLGEDASLGRRVWIWIRPQTGPPLPAARRKIGRKSRPWNLASGVLGEMQWDAFVAPTGSSLPDLIAAEGKLLWPDVRPILEELTEELIRACDEGTLPYPLGVDQVWIEPNGRVQLVDTPLGHPGEEAAKSTAATQGRGRRADEEQQRALALLAGVAVQAMEHRPRPAGVLTAPVQAPLPLQAARCLNRLFVSPGQYTGLRQFEADLRAMATRPPEVTRARRAAHVVLLTAFLGVGLFFMLLAGWAFSYLGTVVTLSIIESEQHTEAGLRASARLDLVSVVVQPDPFLRARAAVEFQRELEGSERLHDNVTRQLPHYEARRQALSPLWRQQLLLAEETIASQSKGAADGPGRRPTASVRIEGDNNWPELQTFWDILGVVTLCLIVIWPVIWVCWAFLLRGGLSFRLLGLTLVTAEGQRAGRLRWAWRTLLVWAPLAGLLEASLLLEEWYWSVWQPGDEAIRWVLWLSWAGWWAGAALLLSYGVLALWFPVRGLHDRLAGTYLVPR